MIPHKMGAAPNQIAITSPGFIRIMVSSVFFAGPGFIWREFPGRLQDPQSTDGSP